MTNYDPETDAAKKPLWRVAMADKTARVVEARCFRVEYGALVLVLPLGCAAYAPSTCLTIEEGNA